MTGTTRILTLTATAVIALGAAAGPSLAAQESGKGGAYSQALAKQLKQAKRESQSKPTKQAKQAERAKQAEKVKFMQKAGLIAPLKHGKPPKSGVLPGFVKPPQHDRSPMRVKPPKADLRPVFVKPPKHGKSPVRVKPPRADVRPIFVKPPQHDRSPVRVNPPKADVRPVFVKPPKHGRSPAPVWKPPYHAPPKHPKHVGSTPYRPMVPPQRHYHKHNQRVVVHHHYNTGHHHSHHDDHGSYLLPFLALGVTAAVLASQPVYSAPPAYPAYQEEVTFNTPRYPVGEPAVYTAPVEAAGPAASCVMTREYQTQISVGGQLVQGYGTACLQPDGSWYHGPAVPEPY